MSSSVRIRQFYLSTGRVNFSISSEHAYFDVNLTCVFLVNGIPAVSFASDSFDLFEGEQPVHIDHHFDSVRVQGLKLEIEITKGSSVLCQYTQSIPQDTGLSFSKAPLQLSGAIIRDTEGGCMTIGIGGIAFGLQAKYNDVLRQCKDYVTKEAPAKQFAVSADDILRERNEFIQLFGSCYLTDAQLEVYALRKKVSDAMIEYGGFQLHGAAVAVDNSAFIFTADSGTGKTTHINLWLKTIPGAYVVNGDHPIIKQCSKGTFVYGSPWCGKEQLSRNTSVPLKAIIIMERGSRNHMTEINFSEAIPDLYRQVYKPSEGEKMKKTLQLLSSLKGIIRFFRFEFDNFAQDALSVSYGALQAI